MTPSYFMLVFNSEGPLHLSLHMCDSSRRKRSFRLRTSTVNHSFYTTTSTSSLLKLTPTIRSGSLKTKVVYTSTGTSPALLLAPASSPAPALALSTISTLLTMMLSTLGSSLLNASYSRSTSSPYLSDAQLAAHNIRCSQRCHL